MIEDESSQPKEEKSDDRGENSVYQPILLGEFDVVRIQGIIAFLKDPDRPCLSSV